MNREAGWQKTTAEWLLSSLLFGLVFVWYALSPFLDLPRLLRIEGTAWIWTPLVFLYPAVFFGLSGSFLLLRWRFWVDHFAVLLAAVGVFGLAVGLIRGNSIRYLIGDFGHVLFAVAGYIAAANMSLSRGFIETFVRRLSAVLTISYASVLFVIYAIAVPAGMSVYIGMGSEPLLLPTAYYLRTGRKGMTALCLALIFLSGKRGVVVAAAFMVPFLVSMMRGRRLWRALITSALCACLAIGGIVFIAHVGTDYLDGRALGMLLKKYDIAAPTGKALESVIAAEGIESALTTGGLDHATSGRIDEALAAIRHFKTIPYASLVGGGAGFVYPVPAWGVAMRHNVHVSPISILTVYGWIGLFLVYGALAVRIIGLYWRRPALPEERVVYDVLFVFAVGVLIYTFFAFELLSEPFLWLALGLLATMAVPRRSRILRRTELRMESN
jgi:hypothetical protein